MTLTSRLAKFLLGTPRLTCAYCGNEPPIGYTKIQIETVFPYFTWRWVKNFFTADSEGERFCSREHLALFLSAGRGRELLEARAN